MLDRKRSTFDWIDLLLLLFVACLAFLPPIDEIHKQLILLAIVTFQFLEGRLIAWLPNRGRVYSVAIKILLATLLLDHTGEDFGINSTYYPIYYLPVVTAAIYFGPIGTLLWTAAASLAYSSFLIPALRDPDYQLSAEGAWILATRILFFFIAAVIVNRFAVENRRQVSLYQKLSETLEETNLQLRRAEADARRSERLAALGQMSAGLAHEIRNPLAVIKGSAEMLSKKLESAEPLAAELSGYISSEVNRLNELIVRFLDFARPSHLEPQAQKLAPILDRSLADVKAQFPTADVRVERSEAADLPEVLADEQLCEHVFVNLIRNAYQAMLGETTPRAKVLRIAAAGESSQGREGVGILFADTGPGVPTDSREQIFNPFFTSKKDGVGMGLAIVAKIIDDHHGWIRLEDNADGGATFHVFLPAAAVASDSPERPAAAAAPGGRPVN